jgi:biotin synthase
VNLLVRAPGTPLEHAPDLDPLELVRTVACARLVAPHARVRLSAGRRELSAEAQALCFLAGANSIFAGDKLLTTPNPSADEDAALMGRLGLRFTVGEARVGARG